MENQEFDVIVVGSGFGGSVTAMRLSQKGYKVAVIEQGKRYRATDFPKTNWNIRKYLWLPLIRCFGFQKITFLRGVMLLHGVGVGGGSLVYANTLMRPKAEIFENPKWPSHHNWDRELSSHYDMATQMLGVTQNRQAFDGELALKKVSKKLGVEESFHLAQVGVYFGKPNEQPNEKNGDPYFNGKGPSRTGCNFCGGCMVGCRYGAKNTLDYNYLYFAEHWGTVVLPERRVTKITPDAKGYQINTVRSTNWFSEESETYRAKKVVLAAGVLGSTEILLKNRDQFKTLPNVSPALGRTVRTNGESLLGATSLSNNGDFSKGLAIGAAIRADEITTVEGVRYPRGSDLMRLLAVPLTSAGNWVTRPLKLLFRAIIRFHRTLRLWTTNWSKNTVILLVMQYTNTELRLRLGRSIRTFFRLGLTGATTDNQPVPSYRPIAQKAAQILADEIQGEPQNVISEVLLRTPATAHILGGCCMADSPEDGVIDSNQEVFGYPGLYVCDGSVIPSNLGVNPSLTITALAERFCEQWEFNPEVPRSEREAIEINRTIEFTDQN